MRGSEHNSKSVITPAMSAEGGSRTHTPSKGYGILNPADGCCNAGAQQDVAADGSFSGPSTGPNPGELVTTNENAERVNVSSERSVASLDRGQEHDAELARIVAAWSELPAVLKGAMLAIVDSAGAASGR